MINLRNDYCGICHPKILEKLVEYQSKTFVGYGLDEISDKAKDIIREKINQKDAAIYILPGGTVTNKVMIAHSLAPYEAVISADTGHVNVHETGAIEETGHKVIAMPNYRGKLKAIDVEKAVLSHPDWHMVKPKMVYISNPTEYGTVYTYQELKELSEMCKKYNLYFYSDGARFASALTSKYADYNIKEFAELFDAFYIGGTKNGLLCGEALVVINKKLQENILYSIKHFGGMQAKGFINGIQFMEMFKDDLFYEIGRKQNELAEELTKSLKECGIKLELETESNQLFPIFKNEVVEKLSKEIMFETWEKKEEETTIRFVCSYMTTKEDVENAIKAIKKYI